MHSMINQQQIVKMLVQNSLHLIVNIVVLVFCTNQGKVTDMRICSHNFYNSLCIVYATSGQVYPSEYAYRNDSVTRTESVRANCRRYQDNLQAGEFTDRHTHCDGNQQKLIDSDLGQKQYQSTAYYVWPAGSDGQLLFLFSMKVSLTVITLHYYSDSYRTEILCCTR